MNCNDAASLLAAYGDGELGPMQSADVEQHLLGCAECALRRDEQAALSARIGHEVPYFAAPASVRSRAEAMFVGPAAPREPSASRALPAREGNRWSWLGAGALAGSMITMLAWLTANTALDWRDRSDLASEAVADHVRATLASHLTDVATSDRHTVKPWLSSRLDYSPPVQDLSGEGFALSGGRVDYLEKRPVATLVYRYREHVVDVFVRPVTGASVRSPFLASTVRGFHVVRANGAGMEWTVVSDASPEVLTAFAAHLARGDASP